MEDEAEVTQSVTLNPPEPSAKVGVTRVLLLIASKQNLRMREMNELRMREKDAEDQTSGSPPHPHSTIWAAGIRVPVR